jgi:hypothetical protein
MISGLLGESLAVEFRSVSQLKTGIKQLVAVEEGQPAFRKRSSYFQNVREKYNQRGKDYMQPSKAVRKFVAEYAAACRDRKGELQGKWKKSTFPFWTDDSPAQIVVLLQLPLAARLTNLIDGRRSYDKPRRNLSAAEVKILNSYGGAIVDTFRDDGEVTFLKTKAEVNAARKILELTILRGSA